MDKNKIKLSIIIPFYNPGNLLNTCLASILDESPASTEIILVDDGSTQEYEVPKNKIIKLIKNKRNMGVSHSRNLGIVGAKGDYIMFVDADDMMKKGWSETVRNAENGEDIIYFSKNNLTKNKYTITKQILGLNGDSICLAGPFSKLFKRNFIKQNGIKFKEDLVNGEDMLFNIEALLASNEIKTVNRGIYLYRNNYSSSTKSFNKRILLSDMSFSNYLEALLPAKYNTSIQTLGINGLYAVLDRIANLPLKSAVKEFKEIDKNFYYKYMGGIQVLDVHKQIAIKAFKNNLLTISYCIIKIRKIASKISKKNMIFTEI